MIDAHTHFFPPEAGKSPEAWAAQRGEYHWAVVAGKRPDGKKSLQGFPTIEKFLSDMDDAGVERAVIQGWYWQNHSTCLEQNAYIARIIEKYPDRLSAFASIQPSDPRAVDIARAAAKMGFCGLGELHDGVQKFSPDSEAFAEIAEIAASEKLAICFHITEPAARQYLGKVPTNTRAAIDCAKKRPLAKFIFAHWCGNAFFETPEIFKGMENAFFDSAASRFTAPKNAFELAEKSPAAGRAIYGSDYPLILYPKLFDREEMKTALGEARGQVSENFAKNLFTKNFYKAIKIS